MKRSTLFRSFEESPWWRIRRKTSGRSLIRSSAPSAAASTYRTTERHPVVTETSGAEAADSLRIRLRNLLSEFVQDLVGIAERAPD